MVSSGIIISKFNASIVEYSAGILYAGFALLFTSQLIKQKGSFSNPFGAIKLSFY